MIYRAFLMFCFCMFSVISGKSQIDGNPEADSVYIIEKIEKTGTKGKGTEVKLPVYQIDSCLHDILKMVVKNDTSNSYFVKDRTAYSFGISQWDTNYPYVIGVRPIYLDKIIKSNYFGVFEFDNRMFICGKGDNTNMPDKLFHKLNSDSITIKFYNEEEIDDYTSMLFTGGDVPSMTKYITCNNLNLYIEIRNCCPKKELKNGKKKKFKN